MIFVFDLDDTLCQTDEYSEKYISNFIKVNNLPYQHISSNSRFAEGYFNWTTEQSLEWYKTYGDEMMFEFPAKENVKEIINSLYNSGNKIIIATARATDWHTEPEKITLEWLEKNNIQYNKIYIGRTDKEQICEKENADIFVDDDVKLTGKVFEHIGHKTKTFLMTTKYNKTIQENAGVIRINNLSDMLVNVNTMKTCKK